MRNKVKQFRDGMFLAPSRTYGETYMEPIIRKNCTLFETPTSENDAKNNNGDAEEIKCTKVLWTKPKGNSLVERIILESVNNVLSRLIPFSDCFTSIYFANIQNVKRDHFSILKYVLLFEDCIKIFEVRQEDISKIPNWCPKHGRYDALGKSGQFAITKNNIKWHLENNLVDTLTWDRVYEITKDIS
jgi:hypothetical protein|tara:strand:- start:344 stop:904 length:561 start_codon:yes stop_codon:yes gene_type:complete